MFSTYSKAGVERNGASLANYYERRGNIPAFSHVALLNQGTAIVGGAGSTDQIDLIVMQSHSDHVKAIRPTLLFASIQWRR